MDGLDGLDGKIALVTGASKGIGAAIAVRLAERGARVAVNYNTSEGLAEQVAASIRDAGSDALTVRADVSDLPQVTAMVERIADDWGAVDILVNNAGIIGDSLLVRMTDEAWGQVIANAVTPGYVRTDTVEVLPQHLKDRIMTWIPQGHFGEVDDIAHLVAFIASEKAKYMTGQVISVDGGMAI